MMRRHPQNTATSGGQLINGIFGDWGNARERGYDLSRSGFTVGGINIGGTVMAGDRFVSGMERVFDNDNPASFLTRAGQFRNEFGYAQERMLYSGVGAHPAYNRQRLVSGNIIGGNQPQVGGILGGLFGGLFSGGNNQSSGYSTSATGSWCGFPNGGNYNNPGILGGVFGGLVQVVSTPFTALGNLFSGRPVSAVTSLFTEPVRGVGRAANGIIGGVFGPSYTGETYGRLDGALATLSGGGRRAANGTRITEPMQDSLEHVHGIIGADRINTPEELAGAYAATHLLYTQVVIPPSVADDSRVDGKTRRFMNEREELTGGEAGDRLNDLMKRAAREPDLLAQIFAANRDNLDVSTLLATSLLATERNEDRHNRSLGIIMRNAHPDTLENLGGNISGQRTITSTSAERTEPYVRNGGTPPINVDGMEVAEARRFGVIHNQLQALNLEGAELRAAEEAFITVARYASETQGNQFYQGVGEMEIPALDPAIEAANDTLEEVLGRAPLQIRAEQEEVDRDLTS